MIGVTGSFQRHRDVCLLEVGRLQQRGEFPTLSLLLLGILERGIWIENCPERSSRSLVLVEYFLLLTVHRFFWI